MSVDPPKGIDDAIQAGLEPRQAQGEEEAAVLRGAMKTARSDRRPVSSYVECLQEFDENFTIDQLMAALWSIRDDIQTSTEPPTTAILVEVQRVLKKIKAPRPAELANEVIPKSETEDKTTAAYLEATVPWTEEVDGVAVLEAVEAILLEYLVLCEGASVAITLWVAHTFLIEKLQFSPRLLLSSPVKRCGKTTTLAVIAELCEKPLPSASISAAALYRVVEAYGPTIIADEADTWIHENEELRGILNSGFYRPTAVAVRCSGDDHEATMFSTFSAVVIALIGKCPETIRDRSIEIAMSRKGKSERSKRLKLLELNESAHEIKRKLARWCTDVEKEVENADPEVPDLSSDRAADLWRVLISIADAAGGEWPKKARDAAIALSGDPKEREEEVGVTLLHDIKEIFEARNDDRIRTETLRDELLRLKERPWPEWRKGKPISPRGIANLLRPFGVSSKTIRFPMGGPQKGYDLADFEESFSRYLSLFSQEPQDPAVTSVTTAQPSRLEDNSFPLRDRHCNGTENREEPRGYGDVTAVTDKTPGTQEKKDKSEPADEQSEDLNELLRGVL